MKTLIRRLVGAGVLTFGILTPGSLEAQDTAGALRVFFECSLCDFDFVRTEITYVDWVRDRADSDLHVIARTQTTGGGGRQYTLDFLGLGRHAGKADTLTYVSGRDDTQDVTRRGLNRVLQIGLMRYVADTDVASQIQIGVPAVVGGTPATRVAPGRDPWNAWVFTVGGNGSTNGESSRTQTNISANLGANRVTEAWKLNYSARGSYGRQSFTYTIPGTERDTTTISITRSYTGNALMVKSLSGHMSVGARLGIGTSTFGNTKFYVNAEPAIEYNVFPYSQSTRQSLLFRYGVGVVAQQYREETVYFLMDETRAVHSFVGDYSTRKTWGTVNLGIDGQQYFHDTDLYNLNFSGSTSVNIVRGLSMSFSGSYSMIRDQISLARRNLTPEEVLLRQRQAATSFRYSTSVGFSYRFGSSFQNVVNPRFGGGSGNF